MFDLGKVIFKMQDKTWVKPFAYFHTSTNHKHNVSYANLMPFIVNPGSYRVPFPSCDTKLTALILIGEIFVTAVAENSNRIHKKAQRFFQLTMVALSRSADLRLNRHCLKES